MSVNFKGGANLRDLHYEFEALTIKCKKCSVEDVDIYDDLKDNIKVIFEDFVKVANGIELIIPEI